MKIEKTTLLAKVIADALKETKMMYKQALAGFAVKLFVPKLLKVWS